MAQGQNAGFSVTVGGIGPFSYQWQLNSNNIPGANSSNYTTYVVQASQDGSAYSVIVNNLDGSVLSSNAYLDVATPVVILTNGRTRSKLLLRTATPASGSQSRAITLHTNGITPTAHPLPMVQEFLGRRTTF